MSSDDGDAYVHLLTEDGSRLAHDDDSGPGVDARIEANLAAGTYQIEATSGAGRVRGAADFTLTVQRATNCEPIDLGTVGAETPLTAEGAWTLESCGARFRDDTPAHTYKFQLLNESSVRIDLIATPGGDPYMYLLAADGTYIYSDDDGAEGRNSRIENDLPVGTYLVEATTYGDREHGHELTDFTLTVEIVDEDEYKLKVEEIYVPEPVVVGQPVTIHYRVGNAGRTDLPETHSATVSLYGPGVYRTLDSISASDGNWKAGDSHHSGEPTAISASVTHSDLKPFNVTFNRPGDNWAFVSIVTNEEGEEEGDEDEEVDFHGFFLEFLALSGFAFDPVTVNVDGLGYEVSAVADEEGEVTTTVTSSITPDSEAPESVRAKALYTAGVLTQRLEGIFDRPAVAGLPTTGEGEASSVADPSSRNLLKLFGQQYSRALRDSGMRTSLLAGQSVNPVEVEDLLLGMAETASARAVSIIATWKGLQSRVGDASPMSFDDAFALHSQLAYAEKVLAPMVAAGAIIEAARDAEMGWEDAGVQDMVGEYEDSYSCSSPTSIASPLRRADVLDIAWMLTADTEMRAALPLYLIAVDSVLCADGADDENQQFLDSLFIGDSVSLLEMFDIAPPPIPAAPPYKLRIVSRLGDDGRVEHGVELNSGEQILPETRHLPADAVVDEWSESSDVMVGEDVIGKIQSRRLEDGRVEVAYITASGRTVTPKVRYLPSDMPAGVWFRSGSFTAPRPDDS